VVKAVLVTHGLLGAELIRTVEGILGPQEGIGAVSNAGTSLETLSERVRSLLTEDDAPVVLFVDLMGGSCSHACQQIRALHPGVVVIAGVNLPMLLDFFHNRDLLPFSDLTSRLLEKGKEGIRCV
jgi:mannose/fructose-specific phosphotransferase system component IIA